MHIADSLENTQNPDNDLKMKSDIDLDEKSEEEKSPDSDSELVKNKINGGSKSQDLEFMVKRFQDFPVLIGIKYARCLEILIMIVNTMVNMVSNLINIVLIATTLEELFGWSRLLSKIISFPLYTIVIFFVLEPEKLKYLTVTSSSLYLFIGNFLFSYCFKFSAFLGIVSEGCLKERIRGVPTLVLI